MLPPVAVPHLIADDHGFRTVKETVGNRGQGKLRQVQFVPAFAKRVEVAWSRDSSKQHFSKRNNPCCCLYTYLIQSTVGRFGNDSNELRTPKSVSNPGNRGPKGVSFPGKRCFRSRYFGVSNPGSWCFISRYSLTFARCELSTTTICPTSTDLNFQSSVSGFHVSSKQNRRAWLVAT